jgi:arylamine N-acetyltransferase
MRDAYLRRLGIADVGPPSAEALKALHAAHRVGRVTSIDPADSVHRALGGRGGYCYHLNGAFSALLRSLGYRVAWHRAGVQKTPADEAGPSLANHEFLSTSPDSGFVRTCVVQRRDATGVDALTGCVLRRLGDEPGSRTVDRKADWFGVLADVFGLGLRDLGPAEREKLWSRVAAAHEAWLAARS